jgi:DNA-binding LacI/PurR family transcriptional regulator
MAIGAMRCFMDNGLSVPGDVAVIGMDNIPECCYLNPPLSSIDPKTEQACKAAADAIVAKLKGLPTTNTVTVEGILNLRESSEI